MSVSLLIISPPSVSLVHSQVRILFSKSVTLLILSPPSVSFVHSQVRILFSMSVSFLILSLFLLCHSFILTLGFFSFSFHSLCLSLILVLYRSVFSSYDSVCLIPPFKLVSVSFFILSLIFLYHSFILKLGFFILFSPIQSCMSISPHSLSHFFLSPFFSLFLHHFFSKVYHSLLYRFQTLFFCCLTFPFFLSATSALSGFPFLSPFFFFPQSSYHFYFFASLSPL